MDQVDYQDYFHTQLSFGSPVSISNYIANVGDGINWLERLTANLKSFKVPLSAPVYQTASNCVSPIGNCGSAGAGIVSIAPGATAVTVSDTAVDATSEILIEENLTYGAALGVLCDTRFGRQYRILSQTARIGFIIETNSPPLSSACLSYTIMN
jgi:hypothetical protein